jgi:hypothetical protein
MFAGCKEMQVQSKLNTEGKSMVGIEELLAKISGIVSTTAPAIPIPMAGLAGTALGALLLFVGHRLGDFARNKATSGSTVAATTALGQILASKEDVQGQIMNIISAVPSHSSTELIPKLQNIFDSFNKKADIIQAVAGIAAGLTKGT